MNLETAENIQCEFEYLALDGYFPMHFASHGQGNKDWQFAVEFIYRLLICQLATLEPIEWNGKKFELNIPFIKTLKNIFVNYEVAWDENNPLFPIISFKY